MSSAEDSVRQNSVMKGAAALLAAATFMGW